MLFKDYSKNYVYTDKEMKNKLHIISGSLSMRRSENVVFPYISSAAGKTEQLCLKKMYSEFLERTDVGFLYNISENMTCVNLKNSKITNDYLKSSLSYSKNSVLGCVDSTGTAAGNSDSTSIIKKSISELIEKNELFLFWYFRSGRRLSKRETNKFELLCDMCNLKNYMFVSQNLSNWPTVICISVKDNNVVSTGISCQESLNKAIEGALVESKIGRTLNLYQSDTMYKYDFSDKERIIDFVSNCNFKQRSYKFNKLYPDYNLKTVDWISDINISFIGTRFRRSGKVVTAFSDSLLKCLPTKENLRYSGSVSIVKRYNYIMDDSEMDCIVS
ncbi:hypothetical protein JF75_05670 [Lactobacillus kimbladii]|uniref:YcaO domain-containing protein n=1 Tax=Lactobacillus kimbladii TaxID=1218506 RepID=A0A0F4LKD2_9LACO|nr:YcaO-like family protein [Lactobacillus kimbladii]KJY59035.1 hypothetical protein JF75_05670 [Lactobacillus kimbladii]